MGAICYMHNNKQSELMEIEMFIGSTERYMYICIMERL